MFSNEEGRLLVVYSAFSQKKKGTIYKISWHFLFTRLVFYLSQRTFFSLTEEHRWTEHTAFHRALAGGRTHRTLQPILAETLCVLCMPKAFCGLETCAKKLRELCVLCERKNFQWTNACAKNALLNLWVLWEIIHPSDLLGCHLIARVRTFSHRITQMNRTHSISQRH